MLGIRKTQPRRERLAVFLIGVVSIGEGLVHVLSLGLLNCEWRAAFLFSDTIDRIR